MLMCVCLFVLLSWWTSSPSRWDGSAGQSVRWKDGNERCSARSTAVTPRCVDASFALLVSTDVATDATSTSTAAGAAITNVGKTAGWTADASVLSSEMMPFFSFFASSLPTSLVVSRIRRFLQISGIHSAGRRNRTRAASAFLPRHPPPRLHVNRETNVAGLMWELSVP